jgi:hypothetical protein
MTFFLQTNREKYCTDIDDDVMDFDSSRFWRPIADWLFENKHFIENNYRYITEFELVPFQLEVYFISF